MARLAKSLKTLRGQLDKQAPRRSKRSDGWIGDAKHRARRSDHNPNSKGVVRAIDITDDLVNGISGHWLAAKLFYGRDPRLKYVIWNRKIMLSYKTADYGDAWVWHPYRGSNPHTKHIHISVIDVPELYDDKKEWDLMRTGDYLEGCSGHIYKRVQQALNRLDIECPVDSADGPEFRAAVARFNQAFGELRKEGSRVSERMMIYLALRNSLR